MSTRRAPRRWPLFLIAAPAAVAVWSGWVGLGEMSGFGIIHPLPGIWDAAKLNTAITLPIGVESYGAYAMGVWLHPSLPAAVRNFARRSAIGSLVLGMLGQIAYHLLAAWHKTAAPWPVVVGVSALPVVTLGFGAALTHLLTRHAEDEDDAEDTPSEPQRPVEPRTEIPAPRVSADSTDGSEADTGPQPVVREPQAAREPVAARSGGARSGGGGHAAPRSRSWTRERRVTTMLKHNPDLTGAEAARKLGVSDRHGQRLVSNARASQQLDMV